MKHEIKRSPSSQLNLKMSQNYINNAFQKKSDGNQYQKEQQKQRIIQKLRSLDSNNYQTPVDHQHQQEQKTQIISSIYVSTQSFVVDKMKILEPTPTNMLVIQKNIEKLLQLQEELQVQEQSYEIKRLLNKIESKLNQYTCQRTKKNNEDEEVCQICFDKKREYVVVPCGHFIYCSECKQQIKDKCLLCQEKVTQVLKIYQ